MHPEIVDQEGTIWIEALPGIWITKWGLAEYHFMLERLDLPDNLFKTSQKEPEYVT